MCLTQESEIFVKSDPKIYEQYKLGELISVHLVSVDTNSNLVQLQTKENIPTLSRANSALSTFDNALKEGYLTKRGNSVQSWKRRWCVLQNNFIVYFKKKLVSKIFSVCIVASFGSIIIEYIYIN